LADNATPYYKKLQILKLKDIYIYEVAKLMYKSIRKKLPNMFTSYFTTVKIIHTRTTRLASFEFNLYLPKYRSNKLQNSFKF